MPARPLSTCLTAAQLQALAAKGIVQADIADRSCTSPALNTCERDAYAVISAYGLYDPDKGQYSRWGDIEVAWGSSPPGKDSRWGFAAFISPVSYFEGDLAVRIEDEGYRVVVYEAVSDLPAFPGLFNPADWSVFCEIRTTDPVLLPTYPELIALYDPFDPADTYVIGSTVLSDDRCGTNTCTYQAAVASPRNPAVYPADWTRLYCVQNGKPSKCDKALLTCFEPYYRLVSLSRDDSDLICAPVPYGYVTPAEYDTSAVES